MFNLDLLPTIDLINDDTDSGRYYYSPEFSSIRYPSVTTILSRSNKFDHSWKDKWIARVGLEAANQISNKATKRGSKLHDICEKYVLNQDYITGQNPTVLGLFSEGQQLLSKNITKVYGTEFALKSEKYNTAGRTDLLADWNGYPAVVDYKTSKHEKSSEDILNYYVQTCIYAKMATDQTGINFDRCVIIMFCDNGPARTYKFMISKYMNLVDEIFLGDRVGSKD